MLKECVRAREKERARESKNIIEGSLERRIYIYMRAITCRPYGTARASTY